ncbi:hypothetical protein [Desertimonas flava]|uniref:hypothetical protein n=1 Tax=Desertimonas flava TaxID=2064846 RepID=UPI0013C4CF34|nr:hypothetical protein [Desertimonas flava]
MTRVRSTTMRVDDLEVAARDFASALGTSFERVPHPTFGVESAVSPIVTLVASHSVPATRGPLLEVEFEVGDCHAAAARLAAAGHDVRRVGDGSRPRHAFELHGLPMVVTAPAAADGPSDAATARFDRAVLVVDDARAASGLLKEVLGVELNAFDVDNMRICVAIGEQGIEFISRLDPVIDIETSWHGTVAGYAVQVHDLDHSRERMRELGAEVTHEFTTPGGLLEVFYGRPGLHGVPLTLIPFHEEGALLESMGLTDGVTTVSPTIG